ncbi:uncharacterized protein LOC128160640 [Crassostrea angulata]|uniref:uncharacterized protein LOC128160640 n=1 Tax=Magallana angulata TaxID=2784310 RepID=UPI0022B1D6D8|nr:uncharacterized protein LOC128160640 [Crassostrea angulata]XP_052679953.1 uncharacterized protein LOC128160640 [Crassostrea angulata]
MDPSYCLQDVVRCDLCKENQVQSYCDFCQVNLCKPCVGEHISDEYEKHKIVPFKERKSTLMFPICNTHSKETCKLQCKSCTVFICALCSASAKHKGHEFIVLEDFYNTKKEVIKKDTEEIENVIVPTYEEIRNELIKQIAMLDGDYEKITAVMSEQGEKWHTEIKRVINKMKNEITEMKEKHRDILKKHLTEIKQNEALIKGNLSALKKVEESNDVSIIVEYRPQSNEFRKFPAKVQVTLPTFCPKSFNRKQVYEMFGSLKPFVFTTNENGYNIKLLKGINRELLDSPAVINTFNTGYKDLHSISFHSEEEIWTSAKIAGDIKCFNADGMCIKCIKTHLRDMPIDIAVTSRGDLVYCDFKSKTLNKLKDGKIQKIIKLQGWTPINLCVISTDDVLVSVFNDDKTRSKVVRYSGSTEKQTFQFDDHDKPLYSGNNNIKYITENRNHDICVADWGAGAIIVVNQEGKLRWRYTGHSSGANKRLIKPHGITTNSQSQILAAISNNHCIHILDQDGLFLSYINNVKNPLGLCVNKQDNLLVAEYFTVDVKVIRYFK